MFANHKLIAFETIVIKEVRRFSRIWLQTLVPPVIMITLYFVIFGNMVGRRIGEMGGFQYMEFIVPGLIMMSVIQNSYSNVVSSFFSHKFQRSIEELLVSPVPNYVILTGFIAGGMARGLAVGAIVTVTAMFFTDLSIQYPLLTIAVILLTSIVFSLAGFINAVFANSFDDISIIPTFVLTPLIYLGGRVLFESAIASVLANRLGSKSDFLHGEYIQVWHLGKFRCQHLLGLLDFGSVHRGTV